MSERSDDLLLADLREALHRISTYTSGMTYEAFAEDSKTQDAVIRNLEILGEATKKLSENLRAEHPEIPWTKMAGARDRLIHHYFGVSLQIVWQIVTVELPALATQLENTSDTGQRS